MNEPTLDERADKKKKDDYNIFSDIHNYVLDQGSQEAYYTGQAEHREEVISIPNDPGKDKGGAVYDVSRKTTSPFDDYYSEGGVYDMPYDAEGGHTKEEAEEEYGKLFRELHGAREEEEILPHSKSNILVAGHINPDTDTIAAAMGYANLKNQLYDTSNYIPVRAGKINDETHFVLEQAGIDPPELLTNAGVQIEDIDIRELHGISGDITLKQAWELLKDKGIVTVPVTEKDHDGRELLNGLITITDIGNIYMDAIDTNLISQAETSYENIREAVDGELVLDDDRHKAARGKVAVGSGDFEMISGYVESGDIVIVSNRRESHMAAINGGASLIIVAMGSSVDKDIIDLAKTNNCAIITTMHDTFTTARLMNQSIPVSFAMTSDNIVKFKTSDYIEDVKKIMSKQKYRDFPVLDEDGYYVGMISRRFLVDTKRKKIILVDHNEKAQAIDDIDEAEILEIIDHHRLSSVETIKPVFFRNEPVGSTSTIIFEMYKENGINIEKKYAFIMCAGILSDTLMFRSPTTSHKDKIAAMELANIAGIDMEEFSASMFRAGSKAGLADPHGLIGKDFKKFTVDGTEIGIGQFNSMEANELDEIKGKVIPLLDRERKDRHLDLIFFMLTDIVAGNTDILFSGKDAKEILGEAFEMEVTEDSLKVEGLISRKKQMVPEIIGAMQQ